MGTEAARLLKGSFVGRNYSHSKNTGWTGWTGQVEGRVHACYRDECRLDFLIRSAPIPKEWVLI